MPVQIDHIHLEVSDRDQAADWFEQILDFQREPFCARWAEDPMGPLILSSPAGGAMLSLFKREQKMVSRDSTIAFKTDALAFMTYLDRLMAHNVRHRTGVPISLDKIVDHDISWSLYFVDPDHNRFELTCYEYDVLKDLLHKKRDT